MGCCFLGHFTVVKSVIDINWQLKQIIDVRVLTVTPLWIAITWMILDCKDISNSVLFFTLKYNKIEYKIKKYSNFNLFFSNRIKEGFTSINGIIYFFVHYSITEWIELDHFDSVFYFTLF